MPTYSVQGPHQTSNLPGYPARDYMAPAGTGVYAWTGLKVVRVSGSSGARGPGVGGFNLYLQDRTGRNYFVTHIENLRVKAGDVIRPGQQFASVGRYQGMATHVHIGYQGGDPVNTLGLRPEYVFTPGGAVAGATAVESAASKSRTTSGSRSIYDIPGVVRGPGGVPLIPGPLPIIEGGIAVGKHLPGVGGAFDTAGSIVDAATSPADAIRWVAGNWDRVLEVVGGSVLVLVGLVLMGRSLGIVSTVSKATPVGKAAAAAGAFAGEREYARAGSPPPARRENLRRSTSSPATDAEERKDERRARRSTVGSSQGSDIPF